MIRTPRRLVLVLTAAALASTALAPAPSDLASDLAGGDADVVQLATAGLTSDNVEYVGTIPIDSPGVGGAVRTHAGTGQRLFYATGLKGLTIYDVSDPALPMPIGFLPFPHSQNEDVSVSEDGTRVVISADGALLLPIMPLTVGIHVVDTTDPTDPVLVASIAESNHTTECADPACNWLYGSSTAGIYDATRADEGVITRVEGRNWNEYVDESGQTVAAGGRHAVNLDEAGLVITDSTPRLVLDPRPHTGADGTEYDYANPEVLAVGDPNQRTDGRLQHNNWRPNATEWVPRTDSPDDAFVDDVNPRSAKPIVLEAGSLRAGEIMIANSESNLNPQCNMAGGLSTWDLRDFDKGRAPVELDVFRPVSGDWASSGDPAVNALGCSGHWFTVQPVSDTKALVTASWYEHGVRFFDVGLDTGKITEIGFFQPVATEAGAAIWVDDEYVYSVDYARGIDILRFDADAEPATRAELEASWLANLDATGAFAEAERYSCRLSVTS